MPNRPVKIPGPDHMITIEPNPGRIIVTFNGLTIADTSAALTLHEANHGPVHYIPRADAAMDALIRSDTTSYCPYKGEASYFTLAVDGKQSPDAIWTYETPYEAVAAIKDHLAFYPDRVDGIVVQP